MTYEQYLRIKKLPYLDGIRGAAILMVIFHHVHLAYRPTGRFDCGFWGVQIFFMLSGFLITTLLLREREATGNIRLGHFYIRRTLRIFPVYYLVLGLYCALVYGLEQDVQEAQEFWRNLPYFLTYTYNLVIPSRHDRVIFFLAWSLAVEEQFYLVWPWLVKYLREWAIMAIVTLAVLPFISKAIVAGCILGFVLDTRGGYRFLNKWLGWLPLEIFESKLLTAFGTISYGIYLTHGLSMRLVSPASKLPLTAFYLIVCAMSFGVASLLYRFYESPFLRLKQHFQ